MTIGALASDTVELDNQASGEESGVIAWGSAGAMPPAGYPPFDVGSLSRGVANQVVSFTVGRPPALDSDVPWSPGDDAIALAYPPSFEVPIKFWILCADKSCTTPVPPWKKANLAGFLVWANERLTAERAGFRLARAGGDEWISDLVGTDVPELGILLDLNTCDCNAKAVAVPRNFKTSGVLNIYMVRTVNTSSREGNSCGTDNTAIVGYRALWGTILHEIGHDLSLWHTNPYPWADDVGGKKNLMYDFSTTRRYLSEGQIFRIHFETLSGLNGSLKGNLPPNLPPNSTKRACRGDDRDPALPCPPEQTLLWSGF